VFALLFRVLWQYYPTFWMCALFWSVVALSEWQLIRMKRERKAAINWWTRTPMLMGVAMNALVTLANDGKMPVLGDHHHLVSVWVVGTGKHLLFLCDRFNGGFAIFSLGDFFIIGGILLGILFWIYRKTFGNSSVSTAK
jgi:hypothetical protein